MTEVVHRGIPPVHCIILTCDSRESSEPVVSLLDICPLHPSGSAWVYFYDVRDKDGSLLLYPERLSLAMVEAGWKLADKVYWDIDPDDQVLQGQSMSRHLGCAALSLRFTRFAPNQCSLPAWAHYMVNPPHWNRPAVEDANWYIAPIVLTCPVDGIVLDPQCTRPYIAEAALSLGRQFIGVGQDVKEIREHIVNITKDVV